MQFKPVKGTRDLLPAEYRQWLKLFELMRNTVELYGYQPIETPAFEAFETLATKTGEEVGRQIYCFEDKAGRKLGLRFDMTVPLARIVASNPQLPKPIRWYYFGKVWRYEEPQALRYREFWQFGIELMGSKSLWADAEVVALAIRVLQSLKLRDFKLFIGHRKVVEGVARSLHAKDVPATLRLVDKKDKLSQAQLLQELANQVERPEVLLEVAKLSGGAEVLDSDLPRHALVQEGIAELKELSELLESYGVLEWCSFDLGIARGLDYYTGVVFEAFETRDGQKLGSAVLGGGRYDELIQVYGGLPTPATGWSIGMERLIELLRKKGSLPKLSYLPQVMVACTPEARKECVRIAERLRQEGISVEYDVMERSLSKQLEHAHALGIPYALILGPRELEKNKIKLKDMQSGEEEEVELVEAVQFIRSRTQSIA